MKFRRYSDISSFSADALASMLEDEVQNNIQIGIITGSGDLYKESWLLTAVTDNDGNVLLTAMCTPPFNLLLYETNGCPVTAVVMLADELKRIGYAPGGVLAERELAHRFASAYARDGEYFRRMTMILMRLDGTSDIKRVPGAGRELRESDLFFAPYWERSFSEDCRVEAFSIEENVKRIRSRLGRGVHLFWEDNGIPVSQAVHGRSTINGAVINGVYTPPHYRGHGYATSVVSEMSDRLLEGGNKFCCLFADEANPVARAVYSKIGYYDVCVFDEIRLR